MARRRLLRVAWVLGALVLALLFLNAFVGRVYRVQSGSMKPALWGDPEEGEYVLVCFGGLGKMQRFDLVVLQRDGEVDPFVKRAVGLPGESVQLLDGDVLIGGEQLAPEAPRPELVLLFDGRRHSLEERFRFEAIDGSIQPLDQGGWRVEAAPAGFALDYRGVVTDGFVHPEGRFEPGMHQVNDLALECALALEEPRGRLRLSLSEEGDLFGFEIRLDPAGSEARLLRRAGSAPEETLASAPIELRPGEPVELAFSNRDDTLRAELNGETVLLSAYGSNTPITAPAASGQRHRKPRLGFAGSELARVTLRDLRVLRDLYYTARGPYGKGQTTPLGPAEVFLLGDCSAHSQDSREWGSVPVERLLGRARWVVWPPGRVRRLVGPESGGR